MLSDAKKERNEQMFWQAHRQTMSRISKPIQYGDKFFKSRRAFAAHIKVDQNNIKQIIDKGSHNGIEIKQLEKEKR